MFVLWGFDIVNPVVVFSLILIIGRLIVYYSNPTEYVP